MRRLFDDFRPVVADQVAFLNRGKGINVPDVQSAIEKIYSEINRTNPTLNIVSVKDFGAKGDGVTDDTEAIRNAIDSLPGGGIVYFPDGVYLVDGTKNGQRLHHGEGGAIKVPSNTLLILSKNATLKQKPTEYNSYNIVYFSMANNSGIIGGKIEGDRKEHLGTGGEWGYGIGVFSSTNILIKDIIISDCWGDGINLNTQAGTNESLPYEERQCRNIIIDNVICDNNRRQGMSIEAAIGVKVVNSIFKNTNGTPPGCGIDIEPWDPEYQAAQNIYIAGCTFENNEVAGIAILNSSSKNIIIKSNMFINNHGSEGQLVTYGQPRGIYVLDNIFLGENGMRFTETNEVFISGNNLRDTGTIAFYGVKNAYVIGNRGLFFEKQPNSYLKVHPYRDVESENVFIKDNFFHSQTAARLAVFEEGIIGKNIEITGNHFSNAHMFGVVAEDSFCIIKDNYITDMRIEGLRISGICILEGNIFSGICYENNGGWIIRCSDGSQVTIIGNYFYKNRLGGGDLGPGRPGMFLSISENAEVKAFQNINPDGLPIGGNGTLTPPSDFIT